MPYSVEMPAQGFPSPSASPLTAATPMRSPVNDPGPFATAKRSISESFVFAVSSRCTAIGSSVSLCVSPVFCHASATTRPSTASAADAACAEDSSARIFMRTPLPCRP